MVAMDWRVEVESVVIGRSSGQVSKEHIFLTTDNFEINPGCQFLGLMSTLPFMSLKFNLFISRVWLRF